MLPEKAHIRRCFNRAANTYDLHCSLQKQTGKELITLLMPYIKSTDKIIDLGCGSGIVTTQLAARLIDYKTFYAIDIADELLTIARTRLNSASVIVNEQDFEDFNYENILFDLVFSNMSLQWSKNLAHTLANIQQNMAFEGLLAFSIPLEGTFLELKTEKNSFFTSIEVTELIQQAGLTLLTHSSEVCVFDFQSWLEAFKSIKLIGANYTFNKTSQSLHGKSYLNAFIKKTFELAVLTYHMGYYLAKKKSSPA